MADGSSFAAIGHRYGGIAVILPKSRVVPAARVLSAKARPGKCHGLPVGHVRRLKRINGPRRSQARGRGPGIRFQDDVPPEFGKIDDKRGTHHLSANPSYQLDCRLDRTPCCN